MLKRLKILLLEDEPNDAEMVVRSLRRKNFDFDSELSSNKHEFIQALAQFEPDVILSDNALPQFSATEALEIVRRQNKHLPFILVTGTVSEEFAATIIKLGADDYILKSSLLRLPTAIESAYRFHESEKEKFIARKIQAESEAKYRILIERVSDGFISLNNNDHFTFVNSKADHLLNKPTGYLLGKHLWTEFPEAKNRNFGKYYQKAIETGENQFRTEYIESNDTWIELNIYPSPSGVSIFCKDITERRKLDQAITKTIIITQEQERNQIGAELHDNINQLLAGSLLHLRMLLDNDFANKKDYVENAIEHITSAIEEIRHLSHRLAPTTVQINSLKESFEMLFKNINPNKKLVIDFQCDDMDNIDVDGDIQLNLYRILQEQMSNILKYSKASHLTVILKYINNKIRMTVRDNGIGFNTENHTEGIGLNNIRKRVELFWGSFKLNTAEGKGCEIIVELPIQKKIKSNV